MSIIDPRKGNEIQRPNIKKIFLDFFSLRFFFCPPSHIHQHPSHSAASAIQPEITLFPPLSDSRLKKKISKKSDCPHTILSEGEKKLPNHHLGCGYVDVWSRVMLLQFPSGRFFSFFLHYFPFFVPHSLALEEENCVDFGHSLDNLFFSPPSRVFRHSVPLLFAPSQNVFFCAVRWTRGEPTKKKVAA